MNKIAVLKISGKALGEIFNNNLWIDSILTLQNNYDGLIIVHGAGKNISEWSQALGHEVKFIDGQRVTTEGVMEIVAAVQSGVLNAKVVSRLISSGINAAGVSGIDYGSFIAENENEALGFVGVPKVTGSLAWLKDLFARNIVPVFSSLCRNEAGELMNVNADIFTEVLASEIKAESVFFVSDVEGVKLKGCYQNSVDQSEIIQGIINGEITDGMIPKLNSCIDLLNKGISRIWIGSKNIEHLFSDKSLSGGTWIVQRA